MLIQHNPEIKKGDTLPRFLLLAFARLLTKVAKYHTLRQCLPLNSHGKPSWLLQVLRLNPSSRTLSSDLSLPGPSGSL
jgi:hypothetical protein